MNFFLRDVWNQSKVIFVFFMLFMLGMLMCTYSKIQITPFFLWAHYSDPQTLTGKHERIYIKVNGEILDLPSVTRPTREMIQLPMEYFAQLERSNYDSGTRQMIRKKFATRFSAAPAQKMEARLCNSKDDKRAYLSWLATYIERVYRKKVHSMEVGTCDLVFVKKTEVRRENLVPIAEFTRP
jgi:hypothetical protein